MKVITDRRLSDTVTAVYAIIVGFVGAILPFTPSRVIAEAVPGPMGVLLYAGLLVAGFMVILGQSMKTMSGPSVLIAGLTITTTFLFAYSIAVIGDRGPMATAAVTLHLVLGFANLFRIY